RRLVGTRGPGLDIPARDRDGRVGVDRVLVALGDAEGPLLGRCGLDAGLEATRPAAAGVAVVVAAHVLLRPLVLVGLRLVRGVGRRRRGRRLVGARGARADVPAGDRDRHVGVDRVLVGLAYPQGRLLGVGLLDANLETARPAATGVAAVPAIL